MNADVSAAYRSHGWTGYGEVGRKPDIGTEDAKAYSREHWVSYTAANGLGVKGGRFLPNYGVHFADHTSFNRSYLGFDKYDQVYGVEVSYTTDKSLFQVTASPGRAESIVDDDGESAFNTTGRVQFDFGPKVVVVGSGFYRAESDVEAQSGAVGGALGLAPLRRLTIWTEGDAYMQDEGTSFVFVNETSWEVVRGVWVKFTPQGRTGFDVVPGIVRVPGVFRWGIGASLFPRTHWNFTFNFYRDSIEDTDEALETFLAQVHIYL
jgi:hypothetical protein